MKKLFGRVLSGVVVPVFLAVLLGFGIMAFAQESLIFFPETLPQDFRYSFPGRFSEVRVPVQGAEINALHFHADSPKGVILYLHGNAGSLRTWGEIAPDFTRHGWDLFLPDYRGYGKSTGKIRDDKTLHDDAAALFAHLKGLYPPERIVLYGRSLGTGIAVKLAAGERPRAVILESAYSSFVDVAKFHYPYLPRWFLNLFMKYTLRTDRWIGAVACPVYLFHGTRDDIIPFASSERLMPLIRGEKRLVAIPGGGHNDLDAYAQYHEELANILR